MILVLRQCPNPRAHAFPSRLEITACYQSYFMPHAHTSSEMRWNRGRGGGGGGRPGMPRRGALAELLAHLLVPVPLADLPAWPLWQWASPT